MVMGKHCQLPVLVGVVSCRLLPAACVTVPCPVHGWRWWWCTTEAGSYWMISVSQAEARAHPLSSVTGPLGCLVLTAIARSIIMQAVNGRTAQTYVHQKNYLF
jgi:hypothetical protein